MIEDGGVATAALRFDTVEQAGVLHASMAFGHICGFGSILKKYMQIVKRLFDPKTVILVFDEACCQVVSSSCFIK